MPSKYLDPADKVMRYVPWNRLRKDEHENVLGVLGSAFELRPIDEYLSVTWCEYFDGTEPEKVRCAAIAIRNSDVQVRSKARFAVAEVQKIKEFMAAAKHSVRFIHESETDNHAHAAIRRWPRDGLELLERLAEEVWHTCYTKEDIDALPAVECIVSQRGAAIS